MGLRQGMPLARPQGLDQAFNNVLGGPGEEELLSEAVIPPLEAQLSLLQVPPMDPLEVAKKQAKEALSFIRESQTADEVQSVIAERMAELRNELQSVEGSNKKAGKQAHNMRPSPEELGPVIGRLLGI